MTAGPGPGPGPRRRPAGPRRRPAGPRRRWAARAAGLLGLVLLIGWSAAWLSANLGGTVVEYGDAYTWDTGSALYLASSHDSATDCTIAGGVGGARRAVRIGGDRPRPLGWDAFRLNGVKVGRDGSGRLTVTCDREVTVSSGPVLWLLPFAYTVIPPILGLLLIVVWGYLTGRNPFRWVVPRSRLPLDPTV